jgi:hypothetical protein
MIHRGIYYLLTNDGTLDSLISSRVEPVIVPPTPEWPLVTYKLANAPKEYTLDGCAVSMGLVQVDSWSLNYDEAHTVANAVDAVLGGYRGDVSTIVTILESRLTRNEDLSNPDLENIYRVSQDYKVMFKPYS